MKRSLITLISASIVCAGFLSSCENNNDEPEVVKNDPPKVEETVPATPFKAIELNSAQRNANAGSKKFAYDMLIKSVAMANEINPNGNVFISPLGLSNFLTMLANGASEEALAEITEALGTDLESLNAFYTLMASELPKADNQVDFSTANSVWLDKLFTPKEAYVNMLKNNFDTDAFVRALGTEETMNEINAWCSQKTKGLIPKFLERPLFLADMFLVNALYFNGKWSYPFETSNTTKSTFYSSDGKESRVDMMFMEDAASYYKLSGGELISKKYGNGSYALNIYLPNEGESIESALTSSQNYLEVTWSMRGCDLSLPKFEVEFNNSQLEDVAEAMGIKKIFSPINSPLIGIAENLFVGGILQKSKLIVNESGAEAAAVTGGIWYTAPEPEIEENAKVVVNRPFIFSITETTNNIILFAGVVRSL